MKASVVHTYGPWNLIYKISYVLCSDGKYRTAWVTGPADTYFSLPARVQVKGKTVTGFVWVHSNEGYRFTRNAEGKNASLLPSWENAHL